MDIKIIKSYPDKELRRTVKADENISVTDERGEYLIKSGYAEKIRGAKSRWNSQSETNGSNESI